MGRFGASIYERALRKTERSGLSEWRARLLGDLTGKVLEIGAGTGLNLEHYPETVTRLVLVEPDIYMRRLLEKRIATHPGAFWSEFGDGRRSGVSSVSRWGLRRRRQHAGAVLGR